MSEPTREPTWEKSFVATSVAIGVGLDDALAAVLGSPGSLTPVNDALVGGLRAADRATRARTLAGAVHEIVLAVDEAALR